MKTISYYIWILERKICKNKRCKTCSKLNENHHCKTWNQKVVRLDNMCILWERKTKQEELKMCNEETKNIEKEVLIEKIKNIKNEEDKEKLMNDYDEKYGDFIQKYIETEISHKSLETGINASLFNIIAIFGMLSLTLLSLGESFNKNIFVVLVYVSVICVIITFLILLLNSYGHLISALKNALYLRFKLLGKHKLLNEIITEIEYNKIKKP